MFEALDTTNDGVAADYNVAPTDQVPIIRISTSLDARVLSLARWGLLPPWARDPRAGARMINARAETVAGSRAYGPSFARRRCLVPADGWYEWCRRDAGTQPYFMTLGDDATLAMAGLWTWWSGGSGPGLLTCTVLTTAAIGELAEIHDRMPLVLPAQSWRDWLSPTFGDPASLMVPPPELLERVEIRPVGAAVGDVRADGPDLVHRVSRRVDDEKPTDLTLF